MQPNEWDVIVLTANSPQKPLNFGYDEAHKKSFLLHVFSIWLVAFEWA